MDCRPAAATTRRRGYLAHGRAGTPQRVSQSERIRATPAGQSPVLRYPPVLRAVLQAELNNSSDVYVAELQRIGAEWLNAHGHYDEALRLAVTSGDWSTASSLIVNNLGIARLLTWPNGCSPAKMFHLASRTRSSPQTSVVCAGLACDTDAAALCLSQAREGIQEHAPTAGAATDLSIAVVQVALAHACGKWADALVWAKEARGHARQPALTTRTD